MKQFTESIDGCAEYVGICYYIALPLLDNATDGSEGKKIPKEALSSGMY